MNPPQPKRAPLMNDKVCAVCSRSASCRNYQVITCDACKMFFRRMIAERIIYNCSKDNKCLDTEISRMASRNRACRACRIAKCLEVGMEYVPQMAILELKNRKDEELAGLLKDLLSMDSVFNMKLTLLFTDEDPSLEEVLQGKKLVLSKRMMKYNLKRPGQIITPIQWSFFGTYIFVSLFMNFSFVQQMHEEDKLKLFQYSTFRASMLVSSMKVVGERNERILTPDGNEIYHDEVINTLKVDRVVIQRICNLLVCRLRELNVSNDEFLILNLIFFCNSAIPSLSDDARSILSVHQKMYTSALFQLCQAKYEQNGPSRLADLLSLSTVIGKVREDLHYITMIFQCHLPDVQFPKLVIDTMQLSQNVNQPSQAEDK